MPEEKPSKPSAKTEGTELSPWSLIRRQTELEGDASALFRLMEFGRKRRVINRTGPCTTDRRSRSVRHIAALIFRFIWSHSADVEPGRSDAATQNPFESNLIFEVREQFKATAQSL